MHTYHKIGDRTFYSFENTNTELKPKEKAKFIFDKLVKKEYSMAQLSSAISEIIISESFWYTKNPEREISIIVKALFIATKGFITEDNRLRIVKSMSDEIQKLADIAKITNENNNRIE